MADEPKVYVAILAKDGFMSCFLSAALNVWKDRVPALKVIDYIVEKVPHDTARNYAVKCFLDTDCTHLLQCDEDISPTFETLEKLLEDDKEIISPCCITIQGFKGRADAANPVSASMQLIPGQSKYYLPYWGEGVEEVDSVTGGCFLVKREVYENPEMRRPFFFSYDDDGVMYRGEDVNFSRKAQDAGYSLWTDYDLVCDHRRLTNLKAVMKRIVIEVDAREGVHAS